MREPAFDDLVTRLQADDPAFARRVDRLTQQQQRPSGTRLYLVLAVLLWAVAPLCVVFGGWAGLVTAIAATAFGTWLMARRPRVVPATTSSAPR